MGVSLPSGELIGDGSGESWRATRDNLSGRGACTRDEGCSSELDEAADALGEAGDAPGEVEGPPASDRRLSRPSGTRGAGDPGGDVTSIERAAVDLGARSRSTSNRTNKRIPFRL